MRSWVGSLGLRFFKWCAHESARLVSDSSGDALMSRLTWYQALQVMRSSRLAWSQTFQVMHSRRLAWPQILQVVNWHSCQRLFTKCDPHVGFLVCGCSCNATHQWSIKTLVAIRVGNISGQFRWVGNFGGNFGGHSGGNFGGLMRLDLGFGSKNQTIHRWAVVCVLLQSPTFTAVGFSKSDITSGISKKHD